MKDKSETGGHEIPADDDVLGVIEDSAVQSVKVKGADPLLDGAGVWHVLVVDDDQEVHTTTSFVLQDVEILGRRLMLHHAYSGAGALEILRKGDHEYAVMLLDVVMETEDAGLRTARIIREEMGLTTIRIILRTGQPGSAPELTVLRDYDINDYRAKTELTRTRLLSSLYVALRSYIHIRNLENNRRGLEKIIAASSELYRLHSLALFGEGILNQISSLLEVETSGIVLVRRTSGGSGANDAEPMVLASAGPFRSLCGLPISAIENQDVRTQIMDALTRRQIVCTDLATALYFPVHSGSDVVALVATGGQLDATILPLLEVFSANIALGFEHTLVLEHIHNLAFFDELTGLPNRNTFQMEAEKALAQLKAEGGARQLMVYILDIDRFQMVNDGLGYRIGDQLLQTVGNRLNLALRDRAIVSRVAGDMFGLLAWISSSAEEAELIAQVKDFFAAPFDIEGNRLNIAASGGYVVAGDAECGASEIIRHAGIALKSAKRSGHCHSLRFTKTLANELSSRLHMVNQFTEALVSDRFRLYFQPQLRIADGYSFGAEALLRWLGADGELISPDLFIPVAEESGHILPIGEWVLRHACRQQVAWRESGAGRLRIAVNVSLRQLWDQNFARTAVGILAETGADPADIELEITESAVMEDDQVFAAVQQLRSLGFQFAIDDFGTGYSSLARLQQLPVSTLKIDRSLVDGIDIRSDRRSIASMIIKMGHELNLSVLAEGVETEAQQAVLTDLGCDSAQGFLYGKPMPADQARQWFEDHARQSAH